MQNRPLEIASQAFRDLVRKVPTRFVFDEDSARAQLSDLIEIYWVTVPLEDEADYQRASQRAEAFLAARKSTRDFNPVTWGKQIPKSSLTSTPSGTRDSARDLRTAATRCDTS